MSCPNSIGPNSLGGAVAITDDGPPVILVFTPKSQGGVL